MGKKWNPGLATEQRVTLTTVAFGEGLGGGWGKKTPVHPMRLSAVFI